MVPECVAEDLPEQQPGEGKCPLLCPTYFMIHCPALLKPKDCLAFYLLYPCLPFGVIMVSMLLLP